MDWTYVTAAIVIGLVTAAVLLHVVLSAALHRHKWSLAFRTARELLEDKDARAMRRILRSGSPGERLGAAMAFSEVTTRPATKALCGVLDEDKDADVRSAAATALAQRADGAAVEALAKAATGDGSQLVRGAAVEGLGASGREAAVPALASVLKEASTRPWIPGVRSRLALGAMAADALGKIGGSRAVAALGAAQAGHYRRIRNAAREAVLLMELRRAAGSERADAATVRKLAAAYIVKRDFDEAISWLDRAARLDPNDAETFETLGTLYQKLGEHEKAESSYKRAIELAPNQPFPHFGLGVIHRDQGRKAAAERAFKRYLELAPEGDQARSTRRFLEELRNQ